MNNPHFWSTLMNAAIELLAVIAIAVVVVYGLLSAVRHWRTTLTVLAIMLLGTTVGIALCLIAATLLG